MHTGFTGVGGFFMAKHLGAVRRRMLNVGLPAVLDDLAKGAPDAKEDGPALTEPTSDPSSNSTAGT
jgi:hypothetical protein